MSFLIEQEMECPACKYPNQVEVWSVVNVKEDPELKDILLGGELNMTDCVSCKKVFYAEHFIIYHDPDQQLMAFVYPFDHRAEADTWRTKTESDFANFQQGAAETGPLKYKPLTLFGMDELVQLVQKEGEIGIQSDIVVALAAEHSFPVQRLMPALARELGLPTVLPLSGDETAALRDRVRAGLEKLLQINDHLFVYRTLLKEMESGQHARFDF